MSVAIVSLTLSFSLLPSLSGMECMQCPARLSLDKVQQLLHHHHGYQSQLSRLNGFVLSEFVQSHELLRWCPGADCSIVFQVKEPLAKKVTCSKCHSTCWYGNETQVNTLFDIHVNPKNLSWFCWHGNGTKTIDTFLVFSYPNISK